MVLGLDVGGSEEVVLCADGDGAELALNKLADAQLQQADLWNAKLQEADLRGAQLQKADLRDARLQEANLHRTHLQGARCNAKTVWPAGFDWQAAGVELLPASESEEARRPDSGRSAEEQGEISD